MSTIVNVHEAKTHLSRLLLWALAAPARLPPKARRVIRDADVYVSAASIWEISIKAALGKLRADPHEVLVEPMHLLTDDAVLGAYGEIVTVV
jgi:hypothetical protein